MNSQGDVNRQQDAHLGNRRLISSADLFKGEREVIIRHENQDYRLLITKAGKLILNK